MTIAVRFLALTAVTVMLAAQAAPPAAAQAMKAPKAKLAPLLSAEELDPQRLLPPPPAEGSPVEKAEVAELHHIQDARTAADLEHAKHNDEREDASIYAAVLGPKFDLVTLPATARLMAQVRADDSAAAKRGKDAFLRLRPWIVDATIVGCKHGDDKPRTSYPSGHATMAFAAATVLSDLAPHHAQDMMRYAQGYAHDRLVCGHHYQSDVVAGEVLGTVVGTDLLHKSELKADIEAARAELHAAGID